MATIKNKPISVVRVSRQFSNQINPTDYHDYRQKETYAPPPLTEDDLEQTNGTPVHHQPVDEKKAASRMKTDVFSLTVPPSTTSQEQFPREKSHANDDAKAHNTSHSRLIVQQQPEAFDHVVRPLPENRSQPHLNWKNTNKWNNGLCSCCDDFNMFCYACSCWCCFRHELTTMMSESWILWFCKCLPLSELRTKFRQRYLIRGSIAEDCCLAACCPLCVALQLANEGRQFGHRIFT